MYREDLDQLVAGFHNTCATVTISDNDNRYDSLEEMRQKGQPKIRAFDIRGENPGVHFLFNQTGVAQSSYPPFQYVFNELRTEEISDAADALFGRLQNFLTKYERPSFRWACIIPMVISLIAGFYFGAHNSQLNKQGQPTIGSPVRFIISLLVFGVFLVIGMNVRNHLSLEKKRDSAPFFIKYRDDFAKIAVGALIIAVISGLAWIIHDLSGEKRKDALKG